MDDALSFLIEAEALGLLTDTPPRVPQQIEPPKPQRRGKKAAKAKRERADK